MSQATFVAFVPRAKRAKLRETLRAADTAPLSWREAAGRNGSEFYFTGPPALARRTHAYVCQWVAGG